MNPPNAQDFQRTLGEQRVNVRDALHPSREQTPLSSAPVPPASLSNDDDYDNVRNPKEDVLENDPITQHCPENLSHS